MKHFTFSDKRAGLSLLESVLALGVSTIGMVALFALMINSNKASKYVGSGVDFNNMSGLIQLIMSGNPATCGSALRSSGSNPVNFNPSSVAAGPIATPISVGAIVLNGNTLVDGTGTPATGWQSRLVFDQILDSSAQPTFLVNMHLQIVRQDTASEVGSKVRDRDFQLAITTDNSGPNGTGLIVSCSNNNASAAASSVAGTVVAFAGATLPPGWKECDGSSLERATYPQLFAAIGTTWGSVDGTHFNLPDFRGRTLIGNGAGALLTNRILGQTGIGSENHTLALAEIPDIPIIANNWSNGSFSVAGGGDQILHDSYSENGATDFAVIKIDVPRPQQSFSLMQPSAVIRWIIKV